ncbi:RhoGAP domain-containing protein [Providencia rettgeri]|uniref:RhoGAP domain-containing protein n=1 Tax=Providencia rettgeri TaxID=587 RepID=UPI0023AAE568|nr:RhoGAP domain-containing protein [Providencia rettgeri]
MKTEIKAPNTPLITRSQETSPEPSEQKNRFIHSIRKVNILANIKNYILRKFQLNSAKHSAPALTETSLNLEKNRLAAKKIEQENIKTINYCKELTNDEKSHYLQLNQLGSAILKHPHYHDHVGFFRKSGNALECEKLILHLLAGKSLKDFFLNKDIVDIKILTSAYKKIAAHLIEKNFHSLEKIPESLHSLADAVQQKSALLKGIFTRDLISENDQKLLSEADSKLQYAFLSLEKTPLTLQLIIPLFAEITKNQLENKMDAYNISICFAPNLVAKEPLTFASNNDSQIYLEALINHELKLQSYDV